MPARDSGSGPGAQDYRTFRGKVLLDETIASVETVAVPDPIAGRKVDQHLALNATTEPRPRKGQASP